MPSAVVNPVADWRLLIKAMGGADGFQIGTDAAWKTLELSWYGGTINAEPSGYKSNGFNDAAWNAGYIPPDPNKRWHRIAGVEVLSSNSRANNRLRNAIWIARREFTIPVSAVNPGTLEITADNAASVWLDGVLLTTVSSYLDLTTVTVPAASLTAGLHTLAVKVTNSTIPRQPNAWGANPTMVQALLSFDRKFAKKIVTVNSTTNRYRLHGGHDSRTGMIEWDYPRLTMPAGGPYHVIEVQVPEDPVKNTGGAFYKMLDGPYPGQLLSKHTNTLGYGSITIGTEGAAFDRGPGAVIGEFHHPNVHSPGASLMYNDAGEIHFTLLVDDPQIRVPKPKETHYTVEFARAITGTASSDLILREEHGLVAGTPLQFARLTGGAGLAVGVTYYVISSGLTANAFKVSAVPGGSAVNFTTNITAGTYWHEVFAGMVWDLDATDTEVVFYGVDYLGLFRYTIDERFDPAFPERSAPTGSKYVDQTITQIVTSQLEYATGQADSVVGFIAIGAIAAMQDKVTIYSTLQSTLPFVTGLLDSHRAGTGKWTRLKVIKIGTTYTVTVVDDPGVNNTALALDYGTLIQGYRAIEHGPTWASRVNLVGRARDGSKLLYKAESSAIDQGRVGRIALGGTTIESVDQNDLNRRALQAAIDASRFGKQISIGTKLGSFAPLEYYDLNDAVPVIIDHGAVTTSEWGNDDWETGTPVVEDSGDPLGTMAGYWSILAIEWNAFDDGHWTTNLTLFPEGRRPFAGTEVVVEQWAYLDTASAVDGRCLLAARATEGNTLVAIVFKRDGLGPATVNGFTEIGTAVNNQGPFFQRSVTMLYRVVGNAAAENAVTYLGDGVRYYSLTSTDRVALVELQGSYAGNYVERNTVADTTAINAGGSITPTADIPAFLLAAAVIGIDDLALPSSVVPGSGVTELIDAVTDNQSPREWLAHKFIGGPTGSYVVDGTISPADNFAGITAVFLPNVLPQAPDVITPRTPLSIGNGAPPSGSNPNNTQQYMDRTTGQLYTWDDDTETWSTTGLPGPTIIIETKRWEPHVDYTGSVMLDSAGNPIMHQVTI